MVKLPGGFVVEVRRARKQYVCFYCRKPIAVGEFYVAIGGVRARLVERYHVACFNLVIPHRVRAVYTDEGPCLSGASVDDSALG